MTKNSKAYHHGDLRDALIEAAIRTMGEQSLDAISLRQLARAVGVSHAAPYHHFQDVDALLAAVAARGFALLREMMSGDDEPQEADPFKRLAGAGTAYVVFAVSHPALFRLMFSGRWDQSHEYPELQKSAKAAFAALEEMIRGASPHANETSNLTAARAAWAMVHGVAMLLVDGRIEIPSNRTPAEAARELTGEVLDVLGRGLRSL